MGKFNLLTSMTLDAAGFKAGIQEAKGSTDGFVNAAEGMSKDITKAFKDISQMGIGEMKRNLQELKSISFAGKTAEEIALINQRIGEVTEEMKDLKAVQSGMAISFGELTVSALQGFTAIAQGAIGVATMFGMDKDKAEEFNQVMVTLIGVSQALATVDDLIATKKLTLIGIKIKETVATVSQTVATKAAAAAQYLLNTAMSLNPVSIVVMAIGALVAAFVALYNKSETFRALVLKVWGVIKGFGAALGTYVVDKIKDILFGLGRFGSALVNLFSGEFKQAVADAKEGFKVMFGFTERPPALDVIPEITDKTVKSTEAVINNTKALEDNIKAQKDLAKEAKKREDTPDISSAPSIGLQGSGKKGVTLKDIGPREQKKFKTATEEATEALEKQMGAVALVNDAMRGFGSIAADAFGEQSAAAKAFAIGSIIASAAMAIMGTWAGYASAGWMGTGMAIAQTVVISALATAQMAQVMGAFANGGIVGGSSWTGDNLTARVNSGEMILNGRQQANLFAIANGGASYGGGELVAKVSGNDLLFVLNRTNKKINNTR